MKAKRFLSMVLVLCIVLTLTACNGSGGGDTNSSDDTTTTVTTATSIATNAVGEAVVSGLGGEVTDHSDDTDDTTVTTVTDKYGNTVTTVTRATQATKTTKSGVTVSGNASQVTVTTKKLTTTTTTKKNEEQQDGIPIKAGSTPLEKGLNFGGRTVTFLYIGTSGGTDTERALYAEFEKQYNCTLKVTGVAYQDYNDTMRSSASGGKTYDIMQFYSYFYPELMVEEAFAPLNDYITTADLWTKGSEKNGGFSRSALQALSLGGNFYIVAGNYNNAPAVLWYNKALFAAAGYTGANDPLALYKVGKWTWDGLYDMLRRVQDTDSGLWGINTLAPYYQTAFRLSFDTELVKLSDGQIVSNMSDPNLCNAFTMLQKFCYGEGKVANPDDKYEPGYSQFLDGKTASMIGHSQQFSAQFYSSLSNGSYPAFGAKAEQLSNLGCVPLPSRNGVCPIEGIYGYGAGKGTDKQGILAALALAKYMSANDHSIGYHEAMSAEMKATICGLLDADVFRLSLGAVSSRNAAISSYASAIANNIAVKGQDAATVLKSYEDRVQACVEASRYSKYS